METSFLFRGRSRGGQVARYGLLVAISLSSVGLVSAAFAADGGSSARGVIRATSQAMISTDLQVRVASIAKKDGEAFKKGEVLVELDCRRQRAELASAEAQMLEMKLTLDNNKVLRQAQAVGRHDLEVSQARVAKASAEADAIRARIDHCKLVAPFDGQVLDLMIQPHETTQPGKPFIGLVARAPLEIELIVPADWLRRLKIGASLAFSVDETLTKHDVNIARIGATVDPVSQTVKIVAVFKEVQPLLLPGMSGTAELVAAVQ